MLENKFIVFCIISFSLWGPKIGLLDTSIIVPLLYLSLSMVIFNGYKFQYNLIILVFFHFAMITYVFFIFIINNGSDPDINLILRGVRALVSTIVLGLIFYNTKIKIDSFIQIILLALLLHPAAIAIQLFYPESMQIFSQFWTFGKYPPFLRAFGLTAGLDTSGYMCIYGQVLSLFLSYKTNHFFKFQVCYLIFLIAAMFTARNAMLISFVIALIFLIFALRVRNYSIRVYIISLISMFSVIGSILIFPLVQYTFFDGSGVINLGSNIELNISETYSKGTFEDLTTNHLVIPSDELEIIFGNAQKPSVDPGYIRLINTLGLVGLSINIFIYFLALIFFVFKYKAISSSRFNNHEKNYIQMLLGVLITYILLVFIFNLKHFFFFTRGFYEILIIIGFYCLQFIKKDKFFKKS